MRHLEARIGQLIGDAMHGGDRTGEQVVHDQLEKRERFDFRILARALNGTCELSKDEWRKSRRLLREGVAVWPKQIETECVFRTMRLQHCIANHKRAERPGVVDAINVLSETAFILG